MVSKTAIKAEATTAVKKERKKPKWSNTTIHKRKRNAHLKDPSRRIVINPSRMRGFIRQQTIRLLKSKNSEKNKAIYAQDFGKVVRCGDKANNLMAQIMEKYVSSTMAKLKANAGHAGRKTVKAKDLLLL